jgi:hypothetical protein
LWNCEHVDWHQLDSRGALGDIVLIWDMRVVEKIKVMLRNKPNMVISYFWESYQIPDHSQTRV